MTINADYQVTFQKDYIHLSPLASASYILNADSQETQGLETILFHLSSLQCDES